MQDSDLSYLKAIFSSVGIEVGNYRENTGLAISTRSERHMNAFKQFIAKTLNVEASSIESEHSTCGYKNGSYQLEIESSCIEKLIHLTKEGDQGSNIFTHNLQSEINRAMQNELTFLLDAIKSVGCSEVTYHPETGCSGICSNSAEMKALQEALSDSFTHNIRCSSHSRGGISITPGHGQDGRSSFYRWTVIVEQELIERNEEHTRDGLFKREGTFGSKFKQKYEAVLVQTTLERGRAMLNKIREHLEARSKMREGMLDNLSGLIEQFEQDGRSSNPIKDCTEFNKEFDRLTSEIFSFEKRETKRVEPRP